MSDEKMIDGDELLARINPQLRRTEAFVCLRADLLLEHDRAKAKLAEMQTDSMTGRLAGQKGGSTAAVKKQAKLVDSIEQQMRDATTRFEFESLSTDAFQALIVNYPPRKDDHIDYIAGYNRDAVNDELVRRCLVNMEFSDAGWAKLRESCAPSEWGELREKAMQANGERVTPPKSPLASQILEQRSAASK